MNNIEKMLDNQWIQILILLLIFWFLFLREDFNDMPNEEQTCKRCIKKIFNENENENINIIKFKNKCIGLDGEYKKENNIKSCINYKAKLDSNYRCSCEIN